MNTETYKTQVQSQGRILIPYNVRRVLSIDEGDWVTVTIKKGEIQL